MKERHLRLIHPGNGLYAKSNSNIGLCEKIKDIISDFLISKNEKIYIIKDILVKIYRDYEQTTGVSDIPYFEKAEKRIDKIIKDNKVNYYYNKLKRFKKDSF